MRKSVVVRSSSRLSCSSQESPTVILCLSSTSLLASGLSTIEGTVTKSYKDTGSCGCDCAPQWSYVVSYDNSKLTDPNSALTADDVTGIFCKGCLTSWVEDIIGNTATMVVNGDGSITYTNSQGEQTTFTPAVACFSDTSSVTMGIDGGGCLYGNVAISADVGNRIALHADGIFVSETDAFDLLPTTDATYDIGSSSFRWNSLYLAENIIFSENPTGFLFRSNNTGSLTVAGGSTPNVVDGALIQIHGSGSATPGALLLETCSGGAPNLTLKNNSATGAILFNAGGGVNKLTLTSAGILLPNSNHSQNLGSTSAHFATIHGTVLFNNDSDLGLVSTPNGSINIGANLDILSLHGAVNLYSNGVSRFSLNTAGNFLPSVTNTYEIGSTGFNLAKVHTRNLWSNGADLNIIPVTSAINLYSNNVQRFTLNTAGNLLPVTDSAYEVGSTGLNLLGLHTHTVTANAANLDLASLTSDIRAKIINGKVFEIYNSSTAAPVLDILSTGQLKNVAANETTGAGNAAFGAGNCPAVTVGAVNTWIKITKSDGSQLYIPAWK